MAGNKNLSAAKAAKKDEFYTQLPDIANELKHYKKHFKGKVVLCNCDDPYESNFFKFFALKFNEWGLKKLICTCYDGSPITGNELLLQFVFDDETLQGPKRIAYKVEITEVSDLNGDGAVDLADVRYLLQNDRNVLQRLKGNGDFRSQECIGLLKEADIVVTNPPFSLFREYIAQLIEFEKKFLIIGNMNALKYKEVFPYLMCNRIWMGYGFNMSYVYKTTYENNLEANKRFVRSKGYNPDEGYIKNPAQCWFTNLEHAKRHEPLDLYKHYTSEEYPRFENFDAINVDEVADIPEDYDGIMGVPITFMGKFCPEQFEILGVGIAGLGLEAGVKPYKPEHKKYRKEIQGRGAVDGDLYLMKDNEVVVPYSRILIRKRK